MRRLFDSFICRLRSHDVVTMTSPSENVELELCQRCGRWGVAVRSKILATGKWSDVDEQLGACVLWLRDEGMPLEADEVQKLQTIFSSNG